MAYTPTNTSSGLHRHYKFAAKTAWGYPFNHLKNVIEHVFAYTHWSKKVAAGSAGAVHAAIATVVAGTTVTTGITNPDVPRVLAITTGGTTNDFAASTVTIVGTNVEGKTITDKIAIADNPGAVQLAGSLVFKTVTSISLDKADSTGGTFTVDTLNKLGLAHRLTPNFGTIVVIQDTVEDNSTAPATQAAPSSSNIDGQLVEKNWVTPATTPDGSTFLYFFYWEHKVKVQPLKDSPDFYSTTTSTSTSTSSTSTSSTSTSLSTSISSTSTSSTSSSTSSTSTSTTTLPI